MSHSQQGMGGHSKDLSFFLFHYHHHHPATLPLCRSTGSMRADRRVCSLLSARIFHDYRQRSQNSTIFFWALYLCNCDICLLYSMGFGSTFFSHFVWLWVKRIDRNRRTGVLFRIFFLAQQQSKSESQDIKWRWRCSRNCTKKSWLRLCLFRPAQLAENPRSKFDQELFPHSA